MEKINVSRSEGVLFSKKGSRYLFLSLRLTKQTRPDVLTRFSFYVTSSVYFRNEMKKINVSRSDRVLISKKVSIHFPFTQGNTRPDVLGLFCFYVTSSVYFRNKMKKINVSRSDSVQVLKRVSILPTISEPVTQENTRPDEVVDKVCASLRVRSVSRSDDR
jgi:hypothetical protein